MPSSPSILREFLISIGFKVDEQSYKNFQSRFDNTIKKFEELGKIATASALAISAAVLKTASDMEKLFFSAQRAGTSVGNLKAIRFAADQIGIGADNAAATIEGLASALRSNPGLHQFFSNLGIKEVSDNTENFLNLIKKLKDVSSQGPFGHAIATQIAGQFGISEQDLFVYEKNLPELVKQMQIFNAEQAKAGVDAQKQAEAFHKFMQDVREFEASVDRLVTIFGSRVLPFVDKIVLGMKRAVDSAIELDKRTNGKSTVAGGIGAGVIATLGAASLAKWFFGLLRGGGAAAAGGEAAAGAGAAAGGEVAAGGAAAAGGPITLAVIAIVVAATLAYLGFKNREELKKGISSGAETAKNWIQNLIAKYEGRRLSAYNDASGNPTIGYGHKIRPGENFAGGISQSAALKLLAQDTSTAMKAVTSLVRVPLNSNQLAALTDFVFNVGSSKFKNSTLLKKLNSGDFAGAAGEFLRWNKEVVNGSLVQSRALTGRRLGEKNLFNKPEVKIDQKNTITVTGVTDPKKAASEVANNQTRLNGDLLRNMQGAVQ